MVLLKKTCLSFFVLFLIVGAELTIPTMTNQRKRILQNVYESEQRVLLAVSEIQNSTYAIDKLLEDALKDAVSSAKEYSQNYNQLGLEGSSTSFKAIQKKYQEVQIILVNRQDLVSSKLNQVGNGEIVEVKRLLAVGGATIIGCAAIIGCGVGILIDVLGILAVELAQYAKLEYERQQREEDQKLYCQYLKLKKNIDCDSNGRPLPKPVPPKEKDLSKCNLVELKDNGNQQPSPWDSDGRTEVCQCKFDDQGNEKMQCKFV